VKRPGTGGGFFVDRTIVGLAEQLRARTVTSAGLVREALASIANLNPALGAFVTVDEKGALDAAGKADRELTEGVDRGPLHGIPVAVKDIIETAGLPTTMGSAHFADHVSSEDAECVRRLCKGGAVIVGKTATHEFAYGPTSDCSYQGPSRNPHNPALMSGGSSGGSSVAVAAGMVPLALGTDTGGSVRIPASLCGIVGFKPAYGVIPTDGVFPLAASLDHVGVLAGTAEDCRIAYWRIANAPAGRRRAAKVLLRVGWVRPGALFEIDREVERTARAALALDGIVLEDVDLADPADVREAYEGIQNSEAYAVHAERVARKPELYTLDVVERLRAAAQTAGWQHVRALAGRERWRHEVSRLLTRHDLLALPTTPVVAPSVGQREIEINGVGVSVRPALLSLTSPWNLAGVPAVSVPAGVRSDLPVGVQLISLPGNEDLLLAAAERVLRGGPPGDG
jgi:Asp-tRNA(Asn)/Glu-tRNA(Gln) amidotransferase A subunit family amidase